MSTVCRVVPGRGCVCAAASAGGPARAGGWRWAAGCGARGGPASTPRRRCPRTGCEAAITILLCNKYT